MRHCLGISRAMSYNSHVSIEQKSLHSMYSADYIRRKFDVLKTGQTFFKTFSHISADLKHARKLLMNDHNPINHLCTESTEMTTHFRILLHLSAGLSTDLSSAEQSLDARGARGGGGGARDE